MTTTPRLVAVLLCLLAGGLPALEYVWWEGESPSGKSDNLSEAHHFNSPHPNLCGGKSLGGDSEEQGTWAEYTIDVAKDGEFRFFVRKFWHHGPFRYRWNASGEWVTVDHNALIDSVQLQQHCINWVKAGSVILKKGPNTVRMEGLKKGAFVFDAFVLVDGPWVPNGTLRPGEKSGKKEAGFWAFEPDIDTFAKADPVNLRGLNEKIAGESGWLKIDAVGGFTDGKGRPMRIWAANTGVMFGTDLADLADHAKHLAKRGINMVRHHGHLNADGGSTSAGLNEETLDGLQRLVATMKQEGIYVTFSPIWMGHSGAPLETTLFWETEVQAAYKRWIKDALTRPNPYDAKKTPVGKDPALGIFQIQNEDSMFFWTTRHALQGERLQKITAIYHAWRQKNGLQGTPPLNLNFWELSDPKQDHKDTMRFFAELQWTWNTEVQRFLREDCGCQALVNAGNWRTADQVRLLDLERWGYSANDVIGINRYVGDVHVNPNKPDRAGYAIDQGDFFTDTSKTINYLELATNARQVAGKTYIIPESTWVPPGTHHSEAPFLVAAYSALTGVDAYYWFALGKIGWDPSVNKWQAASPVIMGGWPAAAFLFRKALVQPGKPVLHEERAADDLWNLRPPVLAEDAGFDPIRDAQISPRSSVKSSLDPKAYLVGPVEVVFAGDPAKSTVQELAAYVDDAAGTITSNTRELVLNHHAGLVTLNAPAAQGATGFLAKAGAIVLKDLTIESANAYATVLVVALDEKPLGESKKVLVQVTTRNHPYGWKTSPTVFTSGKDKDKKEHQGFRIDEVGTSPWQVEEAKLTVTLANRTLRKVTQLDANLYPTTVAVDSKTTGGKLAVVVPPEAMYLLLE